MAINLRDSAIVHSEPAHAQRQPTTIPRLASLMLFQLAIPAAVYTFCFFLLTYPLIWKWSTCFYDDNLDGMQNEWSLWWFRKAVLELHQSPWFTTWLHAPAGLTLVAHTLQPFNGAIAILFGLIFPRVQVYNLIVTGSFVSCGVTAFWLAQHITRSYTPALLGGFAFTFTGFHFAQARGHMEMISAEFMPLFLLAWLRMLEKPQYLRGLVAGVVLGLVALCDFYLVFYCVLGGAVLSILHLGSLQTMVRAGETSIRALFTRFAFFAAIALTCAGPLLVTLVLQDIRDPLLGAHDATVYSADAFSAFVPGGIDVLGRLTQRYWIALTADPSEQSAYVGISVLAMAAYGLLRQRAASNAARAWAAIAVISCCLSLGPVLHVHGVAETGAIMPYAWLEALLPPLKLSGCPSRFSVLLALAVSILASVGLADLSRRRHWTAKALIIAFTLVMAVDLWPIPFATTPLFYPAWAIALRDLPLKGAVISKAYDNPGAELYCQTLFDRPMAFGYVSRLPQSVVENDGEILEDARKGDFTALRQNLGFVYLVLQKHMRVPGLPVVYSDDRVVIQELPPALPQRTR